MDWLAHVRFREGPSARIEDADMATAMLERSERPTHVEVLIPSPEEVAAKVWANAAMVAIVQAEVVLDAMDAARVVSEVTE